MKTARITSVIGMLLVAGSALAAWPTPVDPNGPNSGAGRSTMPPQGEVSGAGRSLA